MSDDLDPAVRAWLGDAAVPAAMARAAAPGAPCVVVLGAGFSGTLAAAQLIRQATRPIHVVVVDRAAAFAAGVAYSTADPRHLLNVPAARMSAWPDRADSFAAWATARDPEASPDDFRPRRDYAAYLRDELIATANAAAPGVSLALRHADVRAVEPRPGGGFVVEPAHAAPGAAAIAADAVVIATGHRAPRDPLAERWRGPRTRFIADPWPSLEPFAIAGDEPVV
ncbi:MAG TPA: FAD/NAD(P)-binding protein, partial [Kofleriaceae bacterium]|nr:FAD/NAD(P)-binding protein [Kofleriaceae bacterium]